MKEATKIIKTLQDEGHYALLVGGCVRDKIMGATPKDYDIVTSATPTQVENIFPDTIPVGKQFGVIIVNKDYEVATFRQDNYNDTDLEVILLDPAYHILEELVTKDSQKRDLTMNAIYLDPITNIFYDPQNGREDIKEGTIRFAGDALERVKEDPIRLLRFYRFGCQYAHMDHHWEDWDVLEDAGSLLLNVSKERIFTEVTKILLHVHKSSWGDFFSLIENLYEVIPELFYMHSIEQAPIHHPEGNVLKHTFQALKSLRIKNEVTVWATLLHDIGKLYTTKIIDDKITSHGHDAVGGEVTERILRDLKCSNSFIHDVKYIVEQHMRIKWVETMRKGKVIQLINNPLYPLLKEVSIADSMGSTGRIQWAFFLDELEKDKPKQKIKGLVTGKDLIALGYTPGEHFKDMLEEASLWYLENPTWSKKDIIKQLNL